MYKLLTILTFLFINNIICNKEDDKLLLGPVELIDLVRKEQHNYKKPLLQKRFSTTDTFYDEQNEKYQTEAEPDAGEDEKTLKNRKIWSRWSKWGECSVTCGVGTLLRHRVCVAGRCAPGEREEQHRPCARAPCLTSTFNITEEMHELE